MTNRMSLKHEGGFSEPPRSTAPDDAPQALPGVNRRRPCGGCGNSFMPIRTTQHYCRSGCRVLAHRRRAAVPLDTLLASGVGAGHIEPAVMGEL
jgi:hypothetical protein